MNATQEYVVRTEQIIATELPWSVAQQIMTLVFNNFDGMQVDLLTWDCDRHDTTYYLRPRRKLNKTQFRDVEMFVRGARAAWR